LLAESKKNPDMQQQQQQQQQQQLPVQTLVYLCWASTLLFAGSLYGFASLQLMAENEGVLHQQCLPSVHPCAAQKDDIALIYSLGSTMQVRVFSPSLCFVSSRIPVYVSFSVKR
jgi:hypothetical protein